MRKVYLGVPSNNPLYCEILGSVLWQLKEGIWKKDIKKKKYWYGVSLDTSEQECCYVFDDDANAMMLQHHDKNILLLYANIIKLIKDKYAADYNIESDKSVTEGMLQSICCEIPCKYLADNAAAKYGDVNTVQNMIITKMLYMYL